MGPNSGGGRKNGGAPNVATRARFSTWKPPNKGKGGGGSDNSEGKGSKKKVDMIKLGSSKGRVASSISAASTRVKSSSAGLPEWVDINAIETITLSRDLLAKIFKYMNSNGKSNFRGETANFGHNDAVNSSVGLSLSSSARPRITVTSRSEDTTAFDKQKSENEMYQPRSAAPVNIEKTGESNSCDPDSNIEELEEKLAKLKLAKVNGFPSSNSSSSSIQTEEQTEILNYFQGIGFTIDEIMKNYEIIQSDFRLKFFDRDSLFLKLLADVSHQSIANKDNNEAAAIVVNDVKQEQLLKKARNNTDLTDECDVLKSIYEKSALAELKFLLNGVCSFVDLFLTEKDLNIPSDKKIPKDTQSKKDCPVLRIRFIIYKAGILKIERMPEDFLAFSNYFT